MPDHPSSGSPDQSLSTHQENLDSFPNGPCLLAYGPADAAGLGHLRRNTNIALRFASEIPSGNALVTGAWPAGLRAPSAPGVDFIKLPSVRRTAGRTWLPNSLRIGLRRLLELRSSIMVSILETLQPEIFLVDYLPIGYCGELQPALDFLKRSSRRTRTVLGLRDILDAPDVVRREWARDGIYDALHQYYDQILIYGDPKIFDAAAEYNLNRDVGNRVTYCGYVGPAGLQGQPADLQDQAAPQDETGPKSAKRLLITGGGGFDAYPMMSMCTDAIGLLSREANLDCTLITGPFMGCDEHQSIERKAAGLPIVVVPYVDDPLDYIRRADLVIGMAGYNAVVETTSLGKKMLVVPRSGPSAEQSMRADIFAAKGYVATHRLEGSSAESFAEAISRSLESQACANTQPNLNGLSKVVDELRAMASCSV